MASGAQRREIGQPLHDAGLEGIQGTGRAIGARDLDRRAVRGVPTNGGRRNAERPSRLASPRPCKPGTPRTNRRGACVQAALRGGSSDRLEARPPDVTRKPCSASWLRASRASRSPTVTGSASKADRSRDETPDTKSGFPVWLSGGSTAITWPRLIRGCAGCASRTRRRGRIRMQECREPQLAVLGDAFRFTSKARRLERAAQALLPATALAR
jgi:hypothetical protein